jgi:hypothetical protein
MSSPVSSRRGGVPAVSAPALVEALGLAQRVAEQGMRRDPAAAGDRAALLGQRHHLERAREHHCVHVGTEIDQRACPAKIVPPGTPATLARVTPPARLTATCCDRGLIAGVTSSAAPNGESPALVSLLSETSSTSHSPRSVSAENSPGVTQRPRPSIVSTPGGHRNLGPCRRDAAVADDHGAVLDWLAAVAEHEGRAGNRELLRCQRTAEQ